MIFWQAWRIRNETVKSQTPQWELCSPSSFMPNVQGILPFSISIIAFITDWSTLWTEWTEKVTVFALSESAYIFYFSFISFFPWALTMCQAETAWPGVPSGDIRHRPCLLGTWRGGFTDILKLSIGRIGWKLASFMISSNRLGFVRTGRIRVIFPAHNKEWMVKDWEYLAHIQPNY